MPVWGSQRPKILARCRFSVAHDITSAQAWAAALVMMALADVLTRLTVLFVRSRRLAATTAAGPVAARAGVHA